MVRVLHCCSGGWNSGGLDPALLEACLCRSHTLAQATPGYSHRHPTPEQIRSLLAKSDADPTHEAIQQPLLFRWEYVDGTRASMLFANNLVGDFLFAARDADDGSIFSTLCHLPPPPNVHYSACLMQCAEQLFVTGEPVLPIERTLIATGINKGGMTALRDGGPQTLSGLVSVRYSVTDTPKFAGGGGFLG